MKLFKTFEIEINENHKITRKYFILDNKRATKLGWKFTIEVQTTCSHNNLLVKNRYFTLSELDIDNGYNYWNKYIRL